MPDNFYATMCNKPSEPLTLKALQDAAQHMGELMKGKQITIQPHFIVLDPKRAKSYRRREKRKRNRDRHLFVTPFGSWYLVG